MPAAEPAPVRDVALVLRFEAPRSDLSIEAMKRELGRLVETAGLRLWWTLPDDELSGSTYPEAVSVRFRGACRMDAGRPPDADRAPGPLAWTHTVDGEVLRFVEVDCARVRDSLYSAMWGEDFQYSDFLFGRALARVVAHELHHALGNTDEHTKKGVTRAALSGHQLLSDDVEFESLPPVGEYEQ